MSSTLAIIPARQGSKRLPNKNQRNFLGRPLVLWTVEFALSHPLIDLVLVTTDSHTIASIARTAGAYVPWLRPSSLSSDTSTSFDVVTHAINMLAQDNLRFDRVALLQPTSPFRSPDRFAEASAMIDSGAPAVIAISPSPSHPYLSYTLREDGSIIPFIPNVESLRSQDLPPAYVVNGSLYIFKPLSFLHSKTFTPPGTRAVVCTDPVESIDIDTTEDWINAERLVSDIIN